MSDFSTQMSVILAIDDVIFCAYSGFKNIRSNVFINLFLSKGLIILLIVIFIFWSLEELEDKNSLFEYYDCTFSDKISFN